MKVLSIDVGIINLGICIMDKSRNILFWEVITLCNSNSIQNCRDMVKKFNERPILLDIDVALVEKQPRCNPKMKEMAMAIKTYFVMKSIELDKQVRIVDWSPKHKLNCYEGFMPDFNYKDKYTMRKKTAIFHTEQLIKGELDKFKELYETTKKKDDLADCYLQVLSFFMFKDQKTVGKIFARRPTPKQKKYNKYSKSNLRYLLNSELDDYLNNGINKYLNNDKNESLRETVNKFIKRWMSEKRISKSLNKYYKNPETRLEEIRTHLLNLTKFD